jgi:hypothetical protein
MKIDPARRDVAISVCCRHRLGVTYLIVRVALGPREGAGKG